MTSEGISTPWDPFLELETRSRRRQASLAIGLVIGTLLGSALTAVAADRIYDAHVRRPAQAAAARAWPARELPPEWRYEVPRVDYERMFRTRR
jgi:hypothetical protein